VVLTAAGAKIANAQARTRGPRKAHLRRATAPKLKERRHRHTPIWDKDKRELWFRDRLIKRFRRPAPDQEAILAAFEEQKWKNPIDDPLPGRAGCVRKRHLRATIDNMNRSLKGTTIRVGGDGTGQGLWWFPVE
jgi:hypothetical protein